MTRWYVQTWQSIPFPPMFDFLPPGGYLNWIQGHHQAPIPAIPRKLSHFTIFALEKLHVKALPMAWHGCQPNASAKSLKWATCCRMKITRRERRNETWKRQACKKWRAMGNRIPSKNGGGMARLICSYLLRIFRIHWKQSQRRPRLWLCFQMSFPVVGSPPIVIFVRMVPLDRVWNSFRGVELSVFEHDLFGIVVLCAFPHPQNWEFSTMITLSLWISIEVSHFSSFSPFLISNFARSGNASCVPWAMQVHQQPSLV